LSGHFNSEVKDSFKLMKLTASALNRPNEFIRQLLNYFNEFAMLCQRESETDSCSISPNIGSFWCHNPLIQVPKITRLFASWSD